MKNMIFSLFISLLIFSACKKEDETGGDPTQRLEFQSLIAENDTINSGETTKIIATASGYKLAYYWSASAGDILGSGAEVLYTSSPCNAGENQIICEVKDGNNQSLTKTIQIVVQ